jgi:mRNA interferase MazF
VTPNLHRPNLHRGDVWWASVPGDKRRPVLVLTRERFVNRLSGVLVAPVTASVRGIPTELLLGPHDGLPRPCAANFDNVFTLDRRRFDRFVASLRAERRKELCAAYRFAAGC